MASLEALGRTGTYFSPMACIAGLLGLQFTRRHGEQEETERGKSRVPFRRGRRRLNRVINPMLKQCACDSPRRIAGRIVFEYPK